MQNQLYHTKQSVRSQHPKACGVLNSPEGDGDGLPGAAAPGLYVSARGGVHGVAARAGGRRIPAARLPRRGPVANARIRVASVVAATGVGRSGS